MSRSGEAEPGEQQSDAEGLSRQARQIAATLRALAGDLVDLLQLETRLAVVSLAAIGIFVVAAGGLLIAGLILLQLAAVWWLREAGLAVGHGLLILGGGNVLLAGCCWLLIVRTSRRLTFANTRAVLARFRDHEPTDEED